MEYNLNSKFNIEKHKKTFINYLEVVILLNGEIEYAVPSHTEKLIKITKLKREEIYELMPIYASPVEWLCEYNKCISVWNEFYIGKVYSKEQEKSLKKLIDHGLLVLNKKR